MGHPVPGDRAQLAASLRAGGADVASWPDRFAIVQSFEDERLRWFGLRLIHWEARAVLPESARLEVEDRLVGQLTGDDTGRLTYEQALAVDNLLDQVIDANGLLAQYRLYLQERSARATNLRGRHHRLRSDGPRTLPPPGAAQSRIG